MESRDLRIFVTYQVQLMRRFLDSLCSLGMTAHILQKNVHQGWILFTKSSFIPTSGVL